MRYIIVIALFVVGCKDSEDRSCWKFAGDPGVKEIELASYDKLFLGPHLHFVLVQDTVDKVVLSGGKNLLNFVETNIDDDGRLVITDENGCGFLREESKKVTVEIHFKKVINIEFQGTEEVKCNNVLNTDYLTLVLRDGAGQFNLNIDAIALSLQVPHGWSNFYVQGNVSYFNVNVRNNSFGNAYGLTVTDSLNAISRSTEIIKINADGCKFVGQTHSSGDIWYIGTPSSIQKDEYGEGRVLDKN